MTDHRRPDRTPTRGRAVRRAAALAALALVSTLLPVAAAAPAHAAQACVSEEPPNLLQPGCDDVVPPETTALAASPAPNAAGWVRSGTVTLTFDGGFRADDETDPGTVGFECRLTGPSGAHGWQACTSPRSYTGLADSAAGAYAFDVRAVDVEDEQIRWTNGLLVPPLLQVEPAPDHDATPLTVTWGVDTTAPAAVVADDGLADPVTPLDPVLASRDWTVRLSSNDPAADFRCVLDGRALPCGPGRTTVRGLATGPHAFSAVVVDPAGNVGATPLTVAFDVAQDLTGTARERRAWTVHRSADALDGSYLESSRRGARLTTTARGVSEVRLVARTAPGAGVVRVRLGRGGWQVFDLDRASDPTAQLVVRRTPQQRFSGTVEVQVASRRGPVRVDGIVLR